MLNKRAGRKRIALKKAKTAPTVMPTRRRGKEINHTIGKAISAISAKGQDNVKRMHHPTNNNMIFIFL